MDNETTTNVTTILPGNDIGTVTVTRPHAVPTFTPEDAERNARAWRDYHAALLAARSTAWR